ncbi:MAG: hypothetical protein UY85_C0055G0007 [Candidatus Peribacteria bacterium GW2011_GWB1_54_5]|nr:MAG: hypothetical protein UY85_C0055G0007 [Candidatus Peribacteria bacterium GW2011_GWB1_54_5]
MTIMKLTLNLADFGIQYEVAEVAIAELEVDKGYQRGETSLINFIAGGHYHTEMFGLKALMAKIQKDLPELSLVFLDVPNKV